MVMEFPHRSLSIIFGTAQPVLKANSRQQRPKSIAAITGKALPARLAQRHESKAKQRFEKEQEKQEVKTKKNKKDSNSEKRNSKKKPASRPLQLSQRYVRPEHCEPVVVRWNSIQPPASNQFLEYILGRDTLYSSQQLASGLSAFENASGDHILQAQQLPADVLRFVTPLVLRGLQLFQQRALPHVIDGRASGGPVDMVQFLAEAGVQEQVQQALHKRAARLKAAGQPVPRKQQMLPHVLHISPDQRKVYIGDEHDVTRNGTRIMSFNKAWKSCPLHTWSGGVKMADMPGGQPPKLVASQLSTLLAPEENKLVQAANLLWDAFAADPVTADAAQRMQAHMQTNSVRAESAIGRTAWNAYAFNITYRTGCHLDGKNVPGSYSALLVCEVGGVVAGGFYMLPQFRAALDIRQGVVVFHRSGDAEVGLHGNAAMWQPNLQSQRIALVLYQTELKVDVDEDNDQAEEADQEAAISAAAPATSHS